MKTRKKNKKTETRRKKRFDSGKEMARKGSIVPMKMSRGAKNGEREEKFREGQKNPLGMLSIPFHSPSS